jgi:hypothetical protein
MTVPSLQWRRPRLRRTATLPRHIRPIRHPGRSRHAYHDPFFADPAVVEDDARRFS